MTSGTKLVRTISGRGPSHGFITVDNLSLPPVLTIAINYNDNSNNNNNNSTAAL